MGQHTSWGAERCRAVRRPATCSQQVCLHEGLSGPRSGPGTCRKGQRAAGALLVIAGGFQKARLGERGTGWSEEKWSGRSPTVWVVTPAMCMSWVGGGALLVGGAPQGAGLSCFGLSLWGWAAALDRPAGASGAPRSQPDRPSAALVAARQAVWADIPGPRRARKAPGEQRLLSLGRSPDGWVGVCWPGVGADQVWVLPLQTGSTSRGRGRGPPPCCLCSTSSTVPTPAPAREATTCRCGGMPTSTASLTRPATTTRLRTRVGPCPPPPPSSQGKCGRGTGVGGGPDRGGSLKLVGLGEQTAGACSPC